MSATATATTLPPTPKPDGAPAVAAERAFRKLLRINFDAHEPVRAYTPPDHSYGESFPGKQRPSTQLTLFSVGVKKSQRR